MINVFSQSELAYAAGFFDGEGCICIALQKGSSCRGVYYPHIRRYFISISMSQNDPAPLRWLVERFGGSSRFLRGKRSYYQWHYERWNWVLSTNAALRFLRLVRPYLIVKASQADLAFKFAETIEPKRRWTPPPVQKQRAKLYVQMKEAKDAFRLR